MFTTSDNIEMDSDLYATTMAGSVSPTPLESGPTRIDAALPMPDIGSVLLHRWRLQAWAGLGTASVVFRGTHVELPLPVAIKIVSRENYLERAPSWASAQ